MGTYAIVENSIVQNVVVWDGNTEDWQPPAGTSAVEVTDVTGPAFIGGDYENGKFSAPTS